MARAASCRVSIGAALVVALCAGSFAFTAAAEASLVVGENANAVTLAVDAGGRALVSFTSGGLRHSVLASGGVNALAPSPGRRQVSLTLGNGGGADFHDACRRYDGPPLPFLVVACKASDGSSWALQSWQRGLPNYGVRPNTQQNVFELRLSHWRGPLPVLVVRTDWAYRRFHHLYGALTYLGRGVYGFRSTSSGSPLDDYGRNIYVDSLDSDYGPGWRRVNSFLTHRPNGTFCYGFYPHGSGTGAGRRYRATVIGPGLTPDVSTIVAPPLPGGTADRAGEAGLLRGDRLCRPH